VAHGVVGASGPAEVVAPMPGAVLRVHAAIGHAVAAGDPVVTLEAMKMEHVVAAPIPGRVTDIRVRPADQVSRGQLLAVIEP
jgi:biotin carboxyl carrier protein